MKEPTFTAENVRRLSETLFKLIQAARLRLYQDQELERELLSLNVVQKGYGWRIDHAGGDLRATGRAWHPRMGAGGLTAGSLAD